MPQIKPAVRSSSDEEYDILEVDVKLPLNNGTRHHVTPGSSGSPDQAAFNTSSSTAALSRGLLYTTDGTGSSKTILEVDGPDGIASSSFVPVVHHSGRQGSNNDAATIFPDTFDALGSKRRLAQESEPSYNSSIIYNPTWVDVLVVYTSQVAASNGGAEATEAFIATAIAATNDAFLISMRSYSSYPVQIHVVKFMMVSNYPDTPGADCGYILDTYLQDDTVVRATADAAKADLVVGVIQEGGCGVAWAPGPNSVYDSNWGKTYGFSVTSITRFADRTLDHEIGHNMGEYFQFCPPAIVGLRP